jgi:hypothetical protein
MKKEYSDLLGEGFHDIPLEDFEERFVHPFNDGKRRAQILRRFEQFVSEFDAQSIPYEAWVDGSFITEKDEPEDVDVVFLVREEELNGASREAQTWIRTTFHGPHRNATKRRYLSDVFLVIRAEEENRGYWQRLFGTYRDDATPKGIARFRFSP